MFARVVFLYEIVYGNNTYYYTNANQDILYSNRLFSAIPIKHSDMENNADEITKAKCEVNITNQCPFIVNVINQYDAFLTSLKVMRYYLATGDVETEFVGTLSVMEFSVKDAKLTFVNLLYDTQRMAMRMIYQRQCPFALYGDQCRAIKDEHSTTTSASAWTRLDDYHMQYTGGVLPDNLAGGMADLPNGSTVFIRGINYDEKIITTSRPIYDSYFQSDDEEGFVILYQGCNRSMKMCNEIFKNSENYGGFVKLPLDNPTTKNRLGGKDADKTMKSWYAYINSQLKG